MLVVDNHPLALLLFKVDFDPSGDRAGVSVSGCSDKNVHTDRCGLGVFHFAEFDSMDFIDPHGFKLNGFELGFEASEALAGFWMNASSDLFEAVCFEICCDFGHELAKDLSIGLEADVDQQTQQCRQGDA